MRIFEYQKELKELHHFISCKDINAIMENYALYDEAWESIFSIRMTKKNSDILIEKLEGDFFIFNSIKYEKGVWKYPPLAYIIFKNLCDYINIKYFEYMTQDILTFIEDVGYENINKKELGLSIDKLIDNLESLKSLIA